MADFPALAHVAVTVTDLDRSVPWYTALFGTGPVLDEDTGPFRHVVWAIGPATSSGCTRSPTWPTTSPFEERRPGLDHIAFACADRGRAGVVGGRLDELGIAHGGIVDAGYGSGVSFRDPDNIALEFFAPPG